MRENPITLRVPRRLVRYLMVVVATALVVAPVTAVAAHRFTDVPDSNIFHGNISWLADAEVTKGCNPPSNTEFCPKDPVTREQMAAFMQRLAENRVVDAATVEGKSAAALETNARSVFHDAITVVDEDAGWVTVLTLTDIPAGQYVIIGKLSLISFVGTDHNMQCRLATGSDFDESWVKLISGGTASLALTVVHTYGTTGTAWIECDPSQAVGAEDIKITAISVNSLVNTPG